MAEEVANTGAPAPTGAENTAPNTETTAPAPQGTEQNTVPETVKDEGVLTDEVKQSEEKQPEPQKEIDPEDLEPSDGVYKFFNEDGTEVSAEDAEGFQSAFKEAHLTSRQAKLMKGAYDKAIADLNDRFVSSSNQWLKEVKADKELGGENLTATKMNIGNALEVCGTPELRQFLKDTRLGNNPEMVRFLNNVGKLVSQDKFVNGNGASRIESAYEMAKRRFPNSPEMWGHK